MFAKFGVLKAASAFCCESAAPRAHAVIHILADFYVASRPHGATSSERKAVTANISTPE